MLPVQLTLLKAITTSALTLQLVQPNVPAESNVTAGLALPNGPPAAASAFLSFNLSNATPQQWDGTIALPLNGLDMSLSSPSLDGQSQLWNNTYISTVNISTGPRPRPPDVPPLPREWIIRCSQSGDTDIKLSSCLAAWASFPSSERTFSFGPRSASSTYAVGLPKRYLSSMFRH